MPFVENVPDLHLALALDMDGALRFADEVILDKFVGGFRDLNAAARAMRLHPAGRVHRVAP